MSMFRRLLLITKLSEDGTPIVIDFTNGVITINDEGKGNKTSINNSEVTFNE